MAPRSSALDESALAPQWHTALLVTLIVAVAVTGTLLERHAPSARAIAPATGPAQGRIVAQYLPILLVNWGLTLYVCRLFRTHNALPQLLGRGLGEGGVVLDLALALVLGVLIVVAESLAVHASGAGRNAAASALLPSTEAERLTWLCVALSVGFCEEVVYRGYLQTQLAALSGRSSLGILLQAVLFGIAHLEQGAAAALRIACYGLALGMLARMRRRLLPGIVCHVGIDLASALLH